MIQAEIKDKYCFDMRVLVSDMAAGLPSDLGTARSFPARAPSDVGDGERVTAYSTGRNGLLRLGTLGGQGPTQRKPFDYALSAPIVGKRRHPAPFTGVDRLFS